jgi:neutral ceramidase
MAEVLQVGAALTAITPATGREMAGYVARTSPAEGVLDDLTCRAVTFTDDLTTLAMVVFDLVYVTADMAAAVTTEVTAALGIPPENVMVSATHTHCGPVLAGPDLVASLARAAATSATQARAEARAAQLRRGRFDVAGLVHNRRDPAGPIDGTGTVLVAVDETGEALVSLVGMACHPTIFEADMTSYSCDYPGVVRDTVERLCGGTAVFVQGFAGDVNPVFYDHSAQDVRLFGRQVGVRAADVVLSAVRARHDNRTVNLSLDRDRPVEPGRSPVVVPVRALRAARCEVPVSAKPQADAAHIRAELGRARADVERASSAEDRAPAVSRVQKWWIEELMAKRPALLSVDFPDPGSPSTLPVQVFQLGDQLSIIAFPGEPMSASALRLRAELGDDVLLVGYANRSSSYLPARHEFSCDGYEVGSTRYEPGTVEALTDVALALIRRRSDGHG